MNIIEEKWDSVVDTLSTEFGFSPISINTWIKPLQVQRYDSDEGTLFIYVPIDEMGINEDFINSYINKKFTTPLRSTIAELTGLDVNLTGAFHLCQLALPGMIRRKAGRILTVSSMWGQTFRAIRSQVSPDFVV